MKASDLIRMFETAEFKGRHGDVVVVRDDAAPTAGERCKDGCLAYGEVTGHAHRVDKAKVLRVVDDLIQRTVVVPAKAKARLDHEEHKANVLPPGTYRSGIQAQYDPETGWAPVQD